MKNTLRNKKKLITYNNKIIDKLINLSEKSEISRSRVCIHLNNKSKTNEMIIALKKGSYIRPHMHPNGKSESYHIIKGKMVVNVFNNKGKLVKRIKMGEVQSNLSFYYRMSKGFCHMPVATSKYCIYHETYSGPFSKKKDVVFPKWSPDFKEKIKFRNFLKKNKLNKLFNEKI